MELKYIFGLKLDTANKCSNRTFMECIIECWLVAVVFLHPLLHVVTLSYASCSAEVRKGIGYTTEEVLHGNVVHSLCKS